ncbi:MAG TPA: methyltransferase domain-containing protein [Candidatus Merdenecus merdavium]|nr:methyltransferase domain-containing protein [Candidatus Merdenecus merdavium]
MNGQITQWVHHFVKEHTKEGDICVDATAGKGFDTLFLCQQVSSSGRVYGFDIQKKALEITRQRLANHGVEGIATLILDSHSSMGAYVEPESVSCIMFNFGYLPGGDHNISTTLSTSIEEIKAGLTSLKKGGLMTLCIYSGGDTGYEEKEGILSFISQLDEKQFLVILSQYYNRPNDPPIPVLIFKKG